MERPAIVGSIMPNKGDKEKSDKADQELYKDLSSFRKEAMHVSDEDHKKWKDEAAHRAPTATTSAPTPKPEAAEPKEETRWDRIQRQERKKKIWVGVLT